MTGRTYRCKHSIRMSVIALCLTGAYSPVVASQETKIASQETKKEADLSCSSSDATLHCASATAKKEIPEAQGQQGANLPEAQDQSNQSPACQEYSTSVLRR